MTQVARSERGQARWTRVEIGEAVVLMIAGVVAGVVNTVAGGGSLLSLPVLMFVGGLSAPVANGTNRIGVLLQSAVGARVMHRSLGFPLRRALTLAIPAVLCSVLGSWLASRVEAEALSRVVGVALLLGGAMLIARPTRLLGADEDESEDAGEERPESERAPRQISALLVVLLMLVGTYGGFLQAGAGVLFILTLALAGGWELLWATGAKNVIIAVYSLPALVVFALQDQIAWAPGLTLACGSVLGGWLGARLALRRGRRFVMALVVAAVMVAALKLLGVGQLLT